jgi:hypothetical protein
LFFGFDVMDDIAFGEGFGMLERNKPHAIMHIMSSGIYVLGRLSPISWSITLLSSLPGANADWAKFEKFSEEQVYKRSKMDRDEGDVRLPMTDLNGRLLTFERSYPSSLTQRAIPMTKTISTCTV